MLKVLRLHDSWVLAPHHLDCFKEGGVAISSSVFQLTGMCMRCLLSPVLISYPLRKRAMACDFTRRQISHSMNSKG